MSSFYLSARTHVDTPEGTTDGSFAAAVSMALRNIAWIRTNAAMVGDWVGEPSVQAHRDLPSGFRSFSWRFDVPDNQPGTPAENTRRVHDIASVVQFHADNALSATSFGRYQGGFQRATVGNFSVGTFMPPEPTVTMPPPPEPTFTMPPPPRSTRRSTPAPSHPSTPSTPSSVPVPLAQQTPAHAPTAARSGIPTAVVVLGALALGGGIWWWLHREPASPHPR